MSEKKAVRCEIHDGQVEGRDAYWAKVRGQATAIPDDMPITQSLIDAYLAGAHAGPPLENRPMGDMVRDGLRAVFAALALEAGRE